MGYQPDPEEQTIASEERWLVWRLIETIEATARVVFIAHEIMEMSMEEIVHTLGIPRSTGRSRLQRARKELTTALQKHRARETFALARKRR